MSVILGLDLGKFKSVACVYDAVTGDALRDNVHGSYRLQEVA
jgi:hypothetical protein